MRSAARDGAGAIPLLDGRSRACRSSSRRWSRSSSVPALGPVGLPGRLLGDALVSVMLVSGAGGGGRQAAGRGDRVRDHGRRIVGALGELALPTADLAVWREVSTLATLVALCCVVLALVVRRGPITTRRIEGAIAGYLLPRLRLGAAVLSWWCSGIQGAFAGAVEGEGSLPWTYYSFVTLTTMGYGDIMPVHPSRARSRCWRR